MLQVIGIVSGILAVLSYIPYASDMLRGRARPERASWLIWGILSGIAFFSQVAKGATGSLWFTGLDGLGAIVIFGLALKYGVGGLTRRDIRALVAAGVGLVLWYLTRNAIYSLIITMAIDAIGTSLTVIKTYDDPSTETYLMWVMVCVAGVLAAASVGKWDPVLLAYPCYIFVANLAVVVAKLLGERRVVDTRTSEE